MPTRHQAHQTGDAAVSAFAYHKPKAWTFQKIDGSHDYGLDGSVQLFEAEGAPLAVGFDVQIKGTEEPDLDKALRTTIDVETFQGYLKHDRPVLVVLHHGPSQSLYVRWAHRPLRNSIAPGQKTLTFHWDREDKWTSETPDQLVHDTIHYRAAVDAGIGLPIAVSVRVEMGDDLSSQDGIRLQRAFRALRSPLVDIDLADPEHRDPLVTISVSALGVQVDVANVTGSQADLPPGFDSATDSDAIAATALLLVALCLAGLGHRDVAGRLLEEHLFESSLESTPAFAAQAAYVLLVAGRYHAVEQLASRALDRVEASVGEGRGPVGLDLADDLLHLGQLAPDFDRDRLDPLMARRTHFVAEHAPTEVAANALAKFAHYLRHGVQYPERNLRAFALLNRVRHLDPGLCDDPAVVANIAGVLYDLTRYRRSADLYARLIELGSDSVEVLARYGDALLMAGWFHAASRLIQLRAASPGHAPSAHWLLKQEVAERLASEYGEAPERDPTGAARLVPATIGDSPSHAQAARDALRLDPLNVSACHNLAIWHANSGEFEQAGWLFARIAVVQPGDARAWADAFFQFIHFVPAATSRADLTLALVTEAALESCEEQFFDAVYTLLDKYGQDEATQSVESFLDRFRTVRSTEGSALVRTTPGVRPPRGPHLRSDTSETQSTPLQITSLHSPSCPVGFSSSNSRPSRMYVRSTLSLLCRVCFMIARS